MISFTSERRKKEIGVRKANGASAVNILILLNKGIIKWVGIATIIASPIAYWAADRWLQNFAYKIQINLIYFLLAGIATCAIALFTVSFKTIKAANSNPVDALKYE